VKAYYPVNFDYCPVLGSLLEQMEDLHGKAYNQVSSLLVISTSVIPSLEYIAFDPALLGPSVMP